MEDDPLKNTAVGSVFNWREGFTFQRTQRGSVLMGTPNGLKVIPANEWASIVAFVSRAGETGETFDAARECHGAADATWEVTCPDCDHGVRGGKPCETCSMTGVVRVTLVAHLDPARVQAENERLRGEIEELQGERR